MALDMEDMVIKAFKKIKARDVVVNQVQDNMENWIKQLLLKIKELEDRITALEP